MQVLVSGNPRDAKKASITGSGPLQECKNTRKPRFADTTLLRTVRCVRAGAAPGPWGGKALTLSLNSTRLMRTPRSYGYFLWLPQCPWRLRKTGFCESGRNYSCPLTRVSVRRTSTVIKFVRTHPYLGVPVVQSHKFSRCRDDCRISRIH